VLRLGLLTFVAASALCAAVSSEAAIIAARFAQGVGGALILPAVLALLRAAYEDAAERTRIFGIWAACTGGAGAAGPLLAGVFVDALSWRAIFAISMVIGLVAAVLLRQEATTNSAQRRDSVPARATIALVALLGCSSGALMQGARIGFKDPLVFFLSATAVVCGVTVLRDPRRRVLLPRELLSARNCVAANATDFALYFGMFGLSFMLSLYAQQVLHYSALWSATVLLPVSIMLLLAERFGRLTSTLGTRPLAIGGAVTAAGGIAWIGSAPHPIAFWSGMILGTTVFGFGMSVAVSSLTHAAVAAVPESCAGVASGLNHAVVRTAGLIAVALLGSLATPGGSEVISEEGFKYAALVCATIVAAGGVAGSAVLRDDKAGGIVRGA
jgi:hypothetical protein